MSTVAASVPSTKAKLRWPVIWTIVVGSLLAWGKHAHLERYITPQRGLGYWLGLVGGSMMVLLLVYSARKRAPWLRWIGSIPAWFDIHMTLGVLGPVLVLFHSNFSLGATNSNVALFCMLTVAGSGVVGRYIYTRLHARMDGKEQTLGELRAVGERLRAQNTSITFLPGLLDAIERIEQRLVVPPQNRLRRALHLLTGGPRLAVARWQVRREVERALDRALHQESEVVTQHARRIASVARNYAERRLEAGRRVAEYKMYAKLFSYWHVLHIPLFFMLLIAGLVHVVAVNVY